MCATLYNNNNVLTSRRQATGLVVALNLAATSYGWQIYSAVEN